MGAERCTIQPSGRGRFPSGVVVASFDERPLDAHYRVEVDDRWTTRSVTFLARAWTDDDRSLAGDYVPNPRPRKRLEPGRAGTLERSQASKPTSQALRMNVLTVACSSGESSQTTLRCTVARAVNPPFPDAYEDRPSRAIWHGVRHRALVLDGSGGSAVPRQTVEVRMGAPQNLNILILHQDLREVWDERNIDAVERFLAPT